MLITHDVEQGTPEWHALRVGLVTASNALVLLTRGKHAATGTHNSSGSGGYWARRGLLLEKQAIQVYESVEECKVERPGFITNDEIPGAGWSPDASRLSVFRGYGS